MPDKPDFTRYIDVQLSRDAGGAVTVISEIETTIRSGGRVLMSEAPCPVLDNLQRAALYARAVSDAGQGAGGGRAALSYGVTANWDFALIGETDPSFRPQGSETVLSASVFCGAAPGTLSRLDLPEDGPQPDGTHVKTQVSFEAGSHVGAGAYMGDIITRGEDRGEALRAMKYALDSFMIEGAATNIPLLSAILSEDRFERGDINADYISEEFPAPFTGTALGKGHCRHIAAVCAFMDVAGETLTGMQRFAVQVDEHSFTVELTPEDGLILAAVDEDSDKATVEVELTSDYAPGNRLIRINIDSRLMILQVRKTPDGFAIYYRSANLDVKVTRT